MRHEFAFFVHSLTPLLEGKNSGELVAVNDLSLMHRLTHVVRVQPGETITLFDERQHAQVVITNIGKKQLSAVITSKQKNSVLQPSITVLLPLLKREALRDAVYACTELGAQEIQLVQVHKAHRHTMDHKELSHLSHVIIAAAEQSKNFAFPVLHAHRALAEILARYNDAHKIRFAVDGNSINYFLADKNVTTSLVIAIGPEGDFTQEEITLFNQADFQKYALTPTVLRAQQALVVGLGIVRSCS